jgi:alpha-tubulin suppressor-like RCC1 family protein
MSSTSSRSRSPSGRSRSPTDRARSPANGRLRVFEISAGGLHSLVLLSNGQVLSFGAGGFGRLGHGDEQDLSVPTAIPGLSTATAVAAGYYHSLVLLRNGQVLSFGAGENGQLGHGGEEDLSVPTAIPGLSTATAVSAGFFHSLVLLSNGQVLSFGKGQHGPLGHGNTLNFLVPTAIPGLSTATAVSAGGDHSLVLLRNGQVLSFGAGENGRLGHGNALNFLVPTAIPGLSTATAVSAGTGGFHSLVLLRNGQVLSFGRGRCGQLGHGDEQDLTVPTAIPGLSTATAVSAGHSHSLVLLRSGQVLSFGEGVYGQLGHRDKQSLNIPVTIPGLSTATAVSAGGLHSLVLLRSGQVLSFGAGEFGQLGHGNALSLSVPTVIQGLTTATPGPVPVPIVNEEEEGLLVNENLNPEEAFDLLQHENVRVSASLTDDRVLFIVVPAVGPRSAFIFDLEDVKTMVADQENYFFPCRGLNSFPLANAPTYVKLSLATNFYFLLSNVQKVVRPTQRSRIFYIVPALHPGTATQKAFEFTCSWSACRSPTPDFVGRAHCQAGSEIAISKFMECRAEDAVSCLQSLAARRPAA